MATIIKRNKHYSVVYKYFDENGKQRQKWETFNTNQEAKKRLKEVEYSMQNDTFIIPSATTVNQENRIKLMLAVARERLPKAVPVEETQQEATGREKLRRAEKTPA